MLPPILEQAQEHDDPQPGPLAEELTEPQSSPHTPSLGEVLEQIEEDDEEQSRLEPVAQAQGLQERGDEQTQSTQAQAQAQPSTAAQQAMLGLQEAEEHPRGQRQAAEQAAEQARPLETTSSRSSSVSMEHDQRNFHERDRSDESLTSAIVTASTPRTSNAMGEAPLDDSDSSMDEALRLQGPSAGQQPMDFL